MRGSNQLACAPCARTCADIRSLAEQLPLNETDVQPTEEGLSRFAHNTRRQQAVPAFKQAGQQRGRQGGGEARAGAKRARDEDPSERGREAAGQPKVGAQRAAETSKKPDARAAGNTAKQPAVTAAEPDAVLPPTSRAKSMEELRRRFAEKLEALRPKRAESVKPDETRRGDAKRGQRGTKRERPATIDDEAAGPVAKAARARAEEATGDGAQTRPPKPKRTHSESAPEQPARASQLSHGIAKAEARVAASRGASSDAQEERQRSAEIQEDISYGAVRRGDESEGRGWTYKTDKERRKRERAPQVLLRKAEARERKLAQLPEEERERLETERAFRNAMVRAQGGKVKDDPKLLQKTIKRKDALKRRHARQWRERIEGREAERAKEAQEKAARSEERAAAKSARKRGGGSSARAPSRGPAGRRAASRD
jgi:hypothetical protein